MKTISTSILILFTILTTAQSTLTGTIKDANEPITWANVVLTTESNVSVTGGITDENGNFKLNVKPGSYTLTVSFLGYEDYKLNITVTGSKNIGILELKETTNTLDEVVVSYTKKLIEQKPDRMVFNVENSIAASGGNAISALKVTPGLQIQNDKINMFGKEESRVMINGKIFPLSGPELISYLNSISANDIKKIEVITTPPAKYDAAGNGGIINIILKKGFRNSWKNTTSFTLNSDRYSYGILSNSLLYNKNKWNASFSLTKNEGSISGVENFQVYYPNSTWDIGIETKDNQDAFSGQLLLDYDLTDKTTVGLQYLKNDKNPDISDVSISDIYDSENNLASVLLNNGNSLQKTKTDVINLHSSTAIDTVGKVLSFDLDYFTYTSDQERNFRTDSFTADGTFTAINSSAITTSNQTIENISFKADMEHPIPFLKLSYGLRISHTKSNSIIENYDTETGEAILDESTSNTFTYVEKNQAGYINGSKKINTKLTVQVGLRAENTETEGYSFNLNQTNKKNYLKLFPSAYLRYTKNENNSFSVSYGRRIRRPRFRDLNPFRVYVSSNTYSEGNPFLQPSFTNTIEFKHTYKNNLTTNAFISNTVDGSGIIFTSNIEESTQIVTRENFYMQTVYGIGESFLFHKFNWLQSQNNITLVNSQTTITKDINAKPQNGFSYTASTNNTFSVNKTTKVQLDASYNSFAKSDLFTVGASYSFDIGLNKSFLNNNLQCAIFMKDVFNTSSLNNLTSTVNNVKQVYGQSRNNRFIRFSASYSFGNTKVKVKNRKFGNEEDTKRTN